MKRAADGILQVRFFGPTLDYSNLWLVVRYLEQTFPTLDSPAIVFDFRAIDRICPPWTAVPALLIRFARSQRMTCRVTGLCGQPASLFALYRKHPVIDRLLAEPDGAGGDGELRRRAG